MKGITMLQRALASMRQDRGWTKVTPAEAASMLPNTQLVDVRQPSEFFGKLGHVEGSLLLPLNELNKTVDRLDASKPTLVICRSGRRSAAACDQLISEGFETVYNLAGGVLAWRADRRTVCQNGQGGETSCSRERLN